MIKLFGTKQAPHDVAAPMPRKKYTRFAHEHTRAQEGQSATALDQPCQAAPVVPKRPAPRPVPEQPQPASLADQLHSESHISVALLRRALPARFADIDAQTRNLAKESVADLMLQRD